ncbi:MAG: response regulator [Verrucomicrobia bacterium]|nr:response regulator [Verrucomicrobiota bacterium]
MKSTIMIIDDEPQNLNLLGEVLKQEGYMVSTFPRGNEAMEAALKEPPSLVLLDILMPHMDGFEVCRQFKSHSRIKDIPILFLSALDDEESKIKAFEAGGEDYVAKPFSALEVKARVNTHIIMSQYRNNLKGMVEEKQRELADAHHRLKIWDNAKNDWLNCLAHAIRTPLTGVFGITDLLFSELTETDQTIALRDVYNTSRERIEKLIDDVMLLSEIDVASEHFRIERVTVNTIVSMVLNDLRNKYQSQNIHLLPADNESIVAKANPKLLLRAVFDLLKTATLCVDKTESIEVGVLQEESEVKIIIKTTGKSLPTDDLALFFEVGGQRTLLTPGGDFGLGPALARRIAQLFGGGTSVENVQPHGLSIVMRIPRN